jgi:hypothetical protein
VFHDTIDKTKCSKNRHLINCWVALWKSQMTIQRRLLKPDLCCGMQWTTPPSDALIVTLEFDAKVRYRVLTKNATRASSARAWPIFIYRAGICWRRCAHRARRAGRKTRKPPERVSKNWLNAAISEIKPPTLLLDSEIGGCSA